MSAAIVVTAIVLVLLVVAFVVIYNRLVRQRNRIDNAWAQVDVQLKRRYNLIPNLIETVKGYAAHEKETFDAVVAKSAAKASRQSGCSIPKTVCIRAQDNLELTGRRAALGIAVLATACSAAVVLPANMVSAKAYHDSTGWPAKW